MRNRLFIILALLVGFIPEALAQTNPSWMRWPSVSPDGSTIAFTFKGNLYKVPAEGGTAQLMTTHVAHDFRAVWSPDAKHLVFASDRYGNFDLFVMPADGGQPKRLTYHSADEFPYSFSPDGTEVLFGGLRQDDVSHRQFPTGSQPELYAVPVEGGQVRQVLTVPAEEVVFTNDGSQLLYQDKKGGENEWRKHHVSAITRDIWAYDMATASHTQLTNFEGEDRNPVVLSGDDHVYYLSEKSGVFNLHRFALSNPSESDQLTSFDLHPVRFLSAGGGKLVFGQHGDIYTMVPGQEAKKITVSIRVQDDMVAESVIPINGGVSEMAVSPNGKEIAIVVRGEVFVTSVSGALTKRITDTPWEEAHLSWGKDGKSLYYAAERDGKWSIFKSTIQNDEEPFFYASTLLTEEPVKADESDHYLPSISPDGKKIAWIQDRITLRVSDIDGGNAITLLDEDDLYTFRDGDQDFSWSPDSQWILFDFSKTLSNGEVLLLSADGKKRENLTNSGYRDWSPAFAEGGKQIIWMSNRYGMKNYATSSSTTYDVFALFLDKARWDDFQLSKEEKELQDELEKAQKEAEEKEDKDEKKKADKEKEAVEPLSIDWDGLEDRKARLTLNSARISSAVLSKDAEKLYYIANYDEDYSLWEVTLREKEAKKVMPIGAGQLVWGPEQKSLYLLSRGRISEVDVKGKSTKPIKIEAMMNLDKSAEMKVLFDHIWLRTSKIFYHSNFHGIDWSLMKQEYEPKVAHLGNEYEFTELISEMIGELNVSHAGARFRGSVVDARDETASLGLLYDWSYDGEGLAVAEVLKGGPMDKAAIDVKPGMILSAIDGEAIPRDTDWVALLNQKAGKRTLLTFTDEKGKALPNVVMKPVSLGQERSLLYKRWVEQNRKEVEERSEGTLGYVHIPGMSDEPYRSIYDDMLGRYAEQEGVIVDTRFNGGGDLVADLAMFFTGEPFLTYLTEKKVVGGEPTSRYTKATLALINEAQYSDGHCFASGYTDLGIGTTVGMPVPGTCSFAGWEGLSNGVVWGIVPVSAQNKAGEWLENNQTEPDVRVKNMPAVISKGRDQQLEKAVEVLLEQVK